MSISSRSRAKGLERLLRFKYNILKWDSVFTLGLNAAKITDKIKKTLQIKLVDNSIF